MDLEWLGDLGIIISTLATTAFVMGYVIVAPFYRTSIGWSLLASKSWICGIAWYAFLRTVLGVDDNAPGIEILRAGLWLGLPVISVSTFWVLLIRSQVRSRHREAPSAEEGN